MEKKTEFRTPSDELKAKVLANRKSDNTNKATKLWISKLYRYLADENNNIVVHTLEELTVENLPGILENFYIAMMKVIIFLI